MSETVTLQHDWISCALCGTDDVVRLLSTRGHKPYRVYAGEMPLPVEGAETLVRCRHCGLAYINPQPRISAGLATYPPSEERAYFEHTRVGRLDGAEQLLSQIKDLLPGCGRVLDIGCGDGVFLAVAQARGWDVFGIEASEHLVAALNAGAMAGRVMYGRAESFCAGPCEYDLVVLLNVLEHLREPMRALRNAVQALRPGGVLAVHVPNYAWGRAYGRHWAQLEPLDHLYYWTPRTLSTALVQVGLSPVARFSLPGTSRWRAQIQRGINAIGLWPGSGLGWLARKANRRT